jgi:hypothetical protein
MTMLLVRPVPLQNQSVECYLNTLARANGFNSIKTMLNQQLMVTDYKVENITMNNFVDLTGHDFCKLSDIGLLPSDQHHQPTNWYGKVPVPSYHLRKEQLICPHCVNETKYCLAKWQIAWLPVCLKHRKPLVQVDRINWKSGQIIHLRGAANDDLYDDRLLEVQQMLEARLESERKGIAIGHDNESVLNMVERQLFRAIGDEKVNQLRERRRKYSRRHFPIPNKDIPKFLECLFTQLIE